MRFCEVQGCSYPVFGTDKLTRTGYCKRHQSLRTDISKETILQKAIAKQRKNAALRQNTNLRKLAVEDDGNREMVKATQSKSELLREADKAFGDAIKRRDADKNGDVVCPCCNKKYNVKQVDKEGKAVVQPLHFIDRGVYSLRWDEDNVHAGCSYCNLSQFLNPKGKEHENYHKFLVDKVGEQWVVEMELAHRKINKITEQQLRTVIEHYSQN
ncbi:MAG: recombination protein NinG [Chitinophagaceae bacterium]|nr:recombination protein NinG [Chitinophagaceae bacterium]